MSVPEEYSGLIRVAKPKGLSDWIQIMRTLVVKPLIQKRCAEIFSGSESDRYSDREKSSYETKNNGNESSVDARVGWRRQGNRERMRCFNCQSDRHLIANCPEPKRNRPVYGAKEKVVDVAASKKSDENPDDKK